MSEAHLRKPASLWLAVTTIFGLLGTVAGLFPVIYIWSQFRAGDESLLRALMTMLVYSSLMLCPIIAWWMLLRRQYKLSLIIASPPILIWVISTIINML